MPPPCRPSSSASVTIRPSGRKPVRPESRSTPAAPLLRLDGVGESAEALDLDGHLVPGLHPELRVAGHANARGRAGDDDVSRPKRHASREKRHKRGDGEDHLPRSPVLYALAVEGAPDGEVLGVRGLVAGEAAGAPAADG